MFVFDKKLDPEQAINFKASSKAPFGYMGTFYLGATAPPTSTTPEIAATDPSQATTDTAGSEKTAAAAFNAVALLTRVRWELGATDPILLEGLCTAATRQDMVALLYAGLTDITVTFSARVFEYDPVLLVKKYYACFDTGLTAPLKGKVVKDGDRELAIELGDDEDLTIQDNSFYAFSVKIVPAQPQVITLASKSAALISKHWGKTLAGK